LRLAIIGGGGIGQVYKTGESNPHEVKVYDTDPALSDFATFDEFMAGDRPKHYIIATPNFTHSFYVEKILSADPYAHIFVEKPGLRNVQEWITYMPNITMVKNNLYRLNVEDLKPRFSGRSCRITWHENNRVPCPGGWFTQKDKAFGGVGQDLMPHLLHFYFYIFGYEGRLVSVKKEQRTDKILPSKYGSFDPSGIFNVETFAELTFKHKDFEVILSADWDAPVEKRRIENDDDKWSFQLCPEIAYVRMLNSRQFTNDYVNHTLMDVKVHQVLDILK